MHPLEHSELVAYRRDAAAIAALLVAVLLVVFAPFVFGRASLMSSARDVPGIYVTSMGDSLLPPHVLDAGAPGWQTEPWFMIEHRLLVGQHVLPFWDPYDGYGTPFAAAMQPQPFYPLSTLVALAPSPRVYTFWVLARLFLAGFFAALFLRLFTGGAGALTAGIAAMLSGYYLLYYNMPHLSVDVGLPMLLWATELVVRRRTPGRIAALAVAAALTYLGGMPETALLSLAVAGLYAVLRVLTTGDFRDRVRAVVGLVGAHALGAAAGAIMLLPFIQFVPASYNAHEARMIGGAIGLAADGIWRHGLLTELAPRVFGNPWQSTLTGGIGHSGVRGFFGCAALVLALTGIIAAVRTRDRRLSIIGFLAVVALFGILKRYGNPLVEWTGGLPLFSLINYPKYIEFVVGVAIALLAGFGVAMLRERNASLGSVTVAGGAALLLLSQLVLATRAEPPDDHGIIVYYLAIAVACVSLLLAYLASALMRGKDEMRARAAIALIAAVLVFEPLASYAGPMLWTTPATVSENTFGGAPYLAFLARTVDRSRDRVFGVGGQLFPNWAGAYGFADPGSLNAMYPAGFLPLVDAFVSTEPSTDDDQHDRFTGTRAISFGTPRVRSWLALSSVRYLVASGPVAAPPAPTGAILGDLWRAAASSVPEDKHLAVHPTVVGVGGVTESALFEHPPFDNIRYDVTVPRDRAVLHADLALDPASYAGGRFCGGAVTFTADAERAGRVLATSTRTIDPKHIAAQRRWLPFELDLSRYAGSRVTLRLATSAADLCAAWAIWGEPRLTASRVEAPLTNRQSVFPEVYADSHVHVYSVPDALPRISVFHNAVSVPDAQEARRTITPATFDVRKQVAVVGSLPRLASPHGDERIHVLSQPESQNVAIEADLRAPGIIVQNDTFFPDWTASVDGQKVPILLVDGLFRGIAVDSGRHLVKIEYRSPVALAGTLISLAASLAILFLFFLEIGPLRLKQRNLAAQLSAGRE